MKQTLIAIVLLLTGNLAFAQEEKATEVPSQIESVTVFLRGAQVTRKSNPQLKKGENILVFRGLADGQSAKSGGLPV